MIREVMKDAVVYLPGKVLPAVVGLVSIPVLANSLSPEIYGNYILVLTTLIFISSVSVSWIISVCIRFNVIYGVSKLHDYLIVKLRLSIAMGCGVWLVVASILGVSIVGIFALIAGLIWLIGQAYYEYFVGWLRARVRPAAYSIAVSWRSIAGLALLSGVLFTGYANTATLILMLAISSLIGLVLLRKYVFDNLFVDDRQESKLINTMEVLRYGIPSAFINLMTLGLSLADRYFINAILGAEALAIYGASYSISEQTIFFVNSILLFSSSVVGFRVFEKEGEDKASEFLSSLIRIYLIAAPPLVSLLILLAPIIFEILLPEGYQKGVEILPIIASSGLFVGIMHRYSLLLSFHKRTDLILLCSTGALAMNLLACWLLIPAYGILGAAVGTFLAYGSWLIFIRIASMRFKAPLFPWTTLGRVLIAILSIFGSQKIISYYFHGSSLSYSVLVAVAGIFFYLSTLLVLKEIKMSDMIVIFRIFK